VVARDGYPLHTTLNFDPLGKCLPGPPRVNSRVTVAWRRALVGSWIPIPETAPASPRPPSAPTPAARQKIAAMDDASCGGSLHEF
jgi:hypothetical protein